MSKGKRIAELRVKKHIKEIYKIMGELETITPSIYQDNKDVEFTEDNIDEIAIKYTNRKLENLERFILLGKLQLLKDAETKDNT